MQQGAKQAAEAFKNAGKKVADSVEQAATAISDFKDDAAEFVQESKHAYEINKYQPVFFDDYISNSFEFPALVRVVEKNKAMNLFFQAEVFRVIHSHSKQPLCIQATIFLKTYCPEYGTA